MAGILKNICFLTARHRMIPSNFQTDKIQAMYHYIRLHASKLVLNGNHRPNDFSACFAQSFLTTPPQPSHRCKRWKINQMYVINTAWTAALNGTDLEWNLMLLPRWSRSLEGNLEMLNLSSITVCFQSASCQSFLLRFNPRGTCQNPENYWQEAKSFEFICKDLISQDFASVENSNRAAPLFKKFKTQILRANKKNVGSLC